MAYLVLMVLLRIYSLTHFGCDLVVFMHSAISPLNVDCGCNIFDSISVQSSKTSRQNAYDQRQKYVYLL